MERIELDLPLRGERDYIQGADIYNAIAAAVQARDGRASGPVRVDMHDISRSQCGLLLGRGDAPEKPAHARAQFRIGEWSGWLVESGESVSRRMPYDEAAITRLCSANGSIIRIREKTTYSPIEVLISATKLLHQKLHPLVDKRWIVTRLEFARLLAETDFDLTIELLQNLNNRLTRSSVLACGEPLGHVYFSAIKA